MCTFLTFVKSSLCPLLVLTSDYDRLPNEHFIGGNYAINVPSSAISGLESKKGKRETCHFNQRHNSSTIKIMCPQCNACLISSNMKALYDSTDTERDIEMSAIKLMVDTKLPKIEVLKMILGRYQGQRRLE